MKKSKLLILTLAVALLIFSIPKVSNAAVQIVSGGTAWTNITISSAFTECKAMANGESTLGVNTLDPHLTTNKDWGAVTYLALSSYGSANYSNTTGNNSGIMNFGEHSTMTSAIESAKYVVSYNATIRENMNTPYVENLPSSATVNGTLGMAISEIAKWTEYPRSYVGLSPSSWGLNRYKFGYEYYYRDPSKGGWTYDFGSENSNVTFRPVIWN